MGARYPRFGAENVTQVAGSYGGISFMVTAVLYILVTVALLAWPASQYLCTSIGAAIAPRRLVRWRSPSPPPRAQPRHLLAVDEEGRPGLEALG